MITVKKGSWHHVMYDRVAPDRYYTIWDDEPKISLCSYVNNVAFGFFILVLVSFIAGWLLVGTGGYIYGLINGVVAPKDSWFHNAAYIVGTVSIAFAVVGVLMLMVASIYEGRKSIPVQYVKAKLERYCPLITIK